MAIRKAAWNKINQSITLFSADIRDTTAVDVNKLAVGVAENDTGTVYIDNVRITK
ncbi:hypothetical protein [Paenibacillus aceris]|uniref:Uncharacterized protein n=1 Tax=Paenibacillus aceris TaxID=869555 RepID=A0ABS4IA06_9BACL|nr:hypothetical protein [Paenibacillus aceris]MBP1967695.1 hypothetical protein [Paenibacillus aceris]